MSQAQWEAVVTALKEATPVMRGLSERHYWTVGDTARMVSDRNGVEHVGCSRYHALLHAAGLSYQQATKVYRHQPNPATSSDWEADVEKK